MSDNSRNSRSSIFEIMDQIMLQLSKTKRMFMVMVLTILILPPIGLIMMTSVFDNPFYPDRRGFEIHSEWEERSAQIRSMLLEIEDTPADQRSEKLKEILNSEEYQEASSKLRQLAQEHPQYELSPQKEKPPVKPLQLIIFVISGIWLGIGIRQGYIISKWDKKYKEFKKREEEIDRKMDEEPED